MLNVEAFISFNVKYIGTEETHHQTPVTQGFFVCGRMGRFIRIRLGKNSVKLLSSII